MRPADLAPVAESLRTADRDRYLAALYAPQEKRGALFALYAFNAEIAGVRDRIHEALPGEIRLQWWRDVLAAPADQLSGHPVADLLKQAIAAHGLPVAAFDNYLEARIFDLYDDPMPSRTDLEGYCGETAGAILQLAALVLDPEAAGLHGGLAGHAACAQAISGLLLLLPRHRARGQCFVSAEILAAAGTDRAGFLSGDGGEAAGRIVGMMAALAREHHSAFLAGAGTLTPTLRAAYLPLALTPAYLAAIERLGARAMVQAPKLSELSRHWLMFRRASKGWPKRQG